MNNTAGAIHQWFSDMVMQSDLTDKEIEKIAPTILDMIYKENALRGDVSNKLRKIGYGADRLKDLYL